MKPNSFKDPTYDYIETEEQFIGIIDSALFQRLRNIIQTSYSPLYSTALHNRFSHSLGVYHLGKIAYNAIHRYLDAEKEFHGISDDDIITIKNSKDDFFLACLLHDIGHAPFSHTGEDFFDYDKLRNKLKDLINDDNFSLDFDALQTEKKTANHEIMSAIVGIENFYTKTSKTKSIEDKIFFARCITGCKYKDVLNVKNCLIMLLNSSVVDVDRLDYVIRDANQSGYQTVSIDYTRLLNGIVIAIVDGKKQIVYDTSAIGVVENAIFAHESQRKWVQNHPIICYDKFLLDVGIKKVEKYLNEKSYPSLFSPEALSISGIALGLGNKIRLLADEDILFIMKNKIFDDCILEYFDRTERRHSLWKSEAEYVHLLSAYITNTDDKRILVNIFNEIDAYFKEHLTRPEVKIPLIDDEAINQVEKTIESVKACSNQKEKEKFAFLSNIKEYLNCFKNFASSNNIKFSFILLFSKRFTSNFLKPEVNNIKVFFKTTRKTESLKNVFPSLMANDRPGVDNSNFFYFYYYKDSESVEPKKSFWNDLCVSLIKLKKVA